jgi:hypothetical protein
LEDERHFAAKVLHHGISRRIRQLIQGGGVVDSMADCPQKGGVLQHGLSLLLLIFVHVSLPEEG